jgi:prepilin-type N-terminal cleavage/methylation domain-containing protein
MAVKEISSLSFRRPASQDAFTLVEVIVGMGLLAVLMFSLYAGLNMGVASVQGARENLRATEILTEKMEIIRLCNFDQLTTPGYLPTSFTAYYQESATSSNGTVYTGTLSISPTGLPVNYSNDLRLVTVSVTWQTKNTPRSRTLSTLASRYGIQRYVYN